MLVNSEDLCAAYVACTQGNCHFLALVAYDRDAPLFAVGSRQRVDAVTLNPFMGYDILEPFLDRPGKAVYLLAVTTNPGSVDVEQQVLANGRKVYQLVGDMVTRSIAENSATEVGMVVGLTNANSQILTDLPDAPLLVPGLGAQGGDLSALTGGARVAPPTINVSRGILYKDPELSFAEKAEKWAKLIREALAL